MWVTLGYIGLILIQLAVMARAILRPHRDPASRIAWVVVIANILFYDKALTAEMQARQAAYLASSNKVEIADVDAWTLRHRLWNNVVGMLSPLL